MAVFNSSNLPYWFKLYHEFPDSYTGCYAAMSCLDTYLGTKHNVQTTDCVYHADFVH